MKPVIHLITTICRGGAENQLLTLIKEQRASGRQVSVLYLKGAPELKSEFEGIDVEVLPQFSNVSPVMQVHRIRRYLGKRDLVVHAHLPRAEIIACLARRKQRLIVTRHNSEKFFPSAPYFISSLLSRVVLGRAHEVIAISNAVLEFMREHREFPKYRSPRVIYYGYAATRKVPRTEDLRELLGIPSTVKVVGTVARLAKQKDIPTLLHAFSKIDRALDLRLIIVGDGPLRLELSDLSKSLGIDHKVIWVGRTERVSDYLSLMDVFVLTSTYEGFGLVLLEALDCQLPIVASNVSAIPEVLGNSYPGLVSSKSVDEFSSKIGELLLQSSTDKLLLQKIGQARLEHFSPLKMRIAIDLLYENQNS